MTKLINIELLFLLAFSATFGQNNRESKAPIDIRLEKCHSIDSNQTTVGMIQCELTAQKEWDAAMNKYYKLLIGILSGENKEKLIIAQRQWLEYRDKELEFSRAMYGSMEGTMWSVVRAGKTCDIVRKRAIEIKEYYETLTQK